MKPFLVRNTTDLGRW